MWEPSKQELSRFKREMPKNLREWCRLRSHGGVWHRVLLRRDGALVRHVSTELVPDEALADEAQLRARCYWCGAPSISSEHVPPRGFYHDVEGNSGITVRSCHAHNEALKVVDEAFITMVSILADADFLNPNRYVRQAAKRAVAAVNSNRPVQKHSVVELRGGGGVPLARVDRETFDLGVEKIARGLYRHHYGEIWRTEQVSVSCPLLFLEGVKPPEMRNEFDVVMDREAPPWHTPEGHAQIFSYQGIRARDALLWRFRFFETVNVHAYNTTRRDLDATKLADRLDCAGPIGEEWFPIPE